MGAHGHPDLAVLVRKAQAAPDEEARAEWLVAIVEEHPDQLDTVAGDWLAAPDPAAQRLGGELLQQVDDPSDDVRERLTVLVATHLARLADPGARAALLSGAWALAEPDLQPAVLRHVADPDPEVRRASVWALAAVEPDDDARQALRALAGDEDPAVAYEAKSALAMLGDADVLLDLLEQEEVHPDIVEAATEVGDPRLHAPLRQLETTGWAETGEDAADVEALRRLLAEAIAATAPR
jgi:HEAT repeat protein